MSSPLLITRLSLSPRTAIGIQTKLIMGNLPGSKHLFWDPHDIGLFHNRSKRVESMLFSWATWLRYEIKGRPTWDKASSLPYQKMVRGAVSRVPRMGLSWWEQNKLKPSFGRRIQKQYLNTASALYLAPMSTEDSERMWSLLQYLKKPFVVHLWDIVDKDQIDSPGFQWMLVHAVHVFCLSEPMIDYIRLFRTDATLLPFTRNQSTHFASLRKSGPLRIALIGTCYRYRDGLSLLQEAISILENQGVEVEIVYVGPQKNIDGWSFSLSKNFRATGFMPTDEARDRALAGCHVGFLPGPLAAPAQNMFSRFSVPSRILDYMAIGLPMVATVHAESATADYMRDIQMEGEIAVTAADLAQKLEMLVHPEIWADRSKASLAAFHVSRQEQRSLQHWLTLAATIGENNSPERRHAEAPTQEIKSNQILGNDDTRFADTPSGREAVCVEKQEKSEE